MKRSLLLAGSIIGTIVSSIEAISALSLLLMVAGYINFAYVLLYVIEILLIITTLMFNIYSITIWRNEIEQFAKMKKIVLCSIIFNLILAVFIFIGLFTSYGFGIFINFLLFASYILATVFQLIDFCDEKQRVAKINNSPSMLSQILDNSLPKTPSVVNNNNNIVNNVENNSHSSDSLEELRDKLSKLEKLKQDKLINEIEYKEIKKKIIDSSL